MHKLFLVYFDNVYIIRAYLGPSSGGTTVCIQQLVLSVLLSCLDWMVSIQPGQQTYLLTPWCRVLLEKLNGLQPVKNFPAFPGNRRFITALTSVRHLSLSWANPIQSIYLLTYSMVQSPSWEAKWFAASQEIPIISRNPKVHYRTHKRPPTVSILGQPNPVHILTYLLYGAESFLRS